MLEMIEKIQRVWVLKNYNQCNLSEWISERAGSGAGHNLSERGASGERFWQCVSGVVEWKSRPELEWRVGILTTPLHSNTLV